jgi:hypothetical protein
MITIISQKNTNTFHPVANPINITVNSNNSGKCNFRYVCDIRINGSSVFKDKLFPDPATGYGFFQLNRILQDYIENFVPKTAPTTYFSAAADGTAPDSVVSVQCLFGEEYDSTTNCSGVVSQYLGLATSNLFYAFNGAIDYESFLTWNYTEYIGFWFNALGSTKFLTNSPREVEVTFNEPYYLEFMSLTAPTISSGFFSEYVAIRQVLQMKDGSTQTNIFNSSTLASRRRFRIGVGPLDINRILGVSIVDDSVKSYTIQLVWVRDLTPSTPLVLNTLSEIFTFKVVRPQTFSTRLGFIGRLGSMESFTFFHRNTKSFNITRSSYNKLLQTNYSGSLTYQVGDRSASTYNIQAVENHKVATYCSRDMSEFLYEMWLSGDVWVYDLPEIICFHTYTYSSQLFLVANSDDHGLKVGDVIFVLLENDPSSATYTQMVKKTIISVDGRIIDVGLNGTTTYSGWIYKDISWRRLPIIISDNNIEVKQKLTKPIEYSLSYSAAYNKYTSI